MLSLQAIHSFIGTLKFQCLKNSNATNENAGSARENARIAIEIS